jgi:hypothetical protein
MPEEPPVKDSQYNACLCFDWRDRTRDYSNLALESRQLRVGNLKVGHSVDVRFVDGQWSSYGK